MHDLERRGVQGPLTCPLASSLNFLCNPSIHLKIIITPLLDLLSSVGLPSHPNQAQALPWTTNLTLTASHLVSCDPVPRDVEAAIALLFLKYSELRVCLPAGLWVDSFHHLDHCSWAGYSSPRSQVKHHLLRFSSGPP